MKELIRHHRDYHNRFLTVGAFCKAPLQVVIISFIFFLPQISLSQTTAIDWELLATVEYKANDKEKAGFLFRKPTFSDTLESLEGKRVTLAGYMLPLTVDQPLYILSKFSFTECFFCNPASGKETVVELHLRGDGKRYKLDAPMRWEGTLALSKDPYGMSFILEDAVPVEE